MNNSKTCREERCERKDCGQIGHMGLPNYSGHMKTLVCPTCHRHQDDTRARGYEQNNGGRKDPNYRAGGIGDYHFHPGVGCGGCGTYWIPEFVQDWVGPEAVAA